MSIEVKLRTARRLCPENKLLLKAFDAGPEDRLYVLWEKEPSPSGVMHPSYCWKIIATSTSTIQCAYNEEFVISAIPNLGGDLDYFEAELDKALQSLVAVTDMKSGYIEDLEEELVEQLRIKNENFMNEFKKAQAAGSAAEFIKKVLETQSLEASPSLTVIEEDNE